MFIGKDAEDLICEGLPDGFHALEVKYHLLEELNTSKQALGLRAGHELISTEFRQVDRHNRFIECVVLALSIFVEYFLCCASGVVVKDHKYGRARLFL